MPRIEIAEPLPPEGVAVPLRATFVGVARVPLLALGKNNLSALLRLYENRLEFKVFRRRQRAYSEIRRVEVATLFLTRNVEIVWTDSPLTFAANIRGDDWRRAVLELLARKGAPLSPAARALIEEG